MSLSHLPAPEPRDVVLTDEHVAYSPDQAAEQLGVGKSLLYELMASGEIQYIRIGRLRRIPHAELVRFVDSKRD